GRRRERDCFGWRSCSKGCIRQLETREWVETAHGVTESAKHTSEGRIHFVASSRNRYSDITNKKERNHGKSTWYRPTAGQGRPTRARQGWPASARTGRSA